jgi:hypothetical protein
MPVFCLTIDFVRKPHKINRQTFLWAVGGLGYNS